MLSSTSIHPEQQQAERDNNLLLFWGFFLGKATNKRQIDSAVRPQCAGSLHKHHSSPHQHHSGSHAGCSGTHWVVATSPSFCQVPPAAPNSLREEPGAGSSPQRRQAQTTASAAAPFSKHHHTHWQTGNCAWARHRILLFTRAGAEVERNFSLLASTSSWPPSRCAHALGCSHL